MRKRVISVQSPAADRFALVVSTVVGFGSIAKVEPVVGNIKVRQVYDPSGRFTYEDLTFGTVDRVRVYRRSYFDGSEWNSFPMPLDGLHIHLDHVEWIGEPFGYPSIVGTIVDVDGWVGIRLWDLVKLLSRADYPIPKTTTPATACEAKLAFLGLVARQEDVQFHGLRVELNFDRNTAPASISYIRPGKTVEYCESKNPELLQKSRLTVGISGEIVAAVFSRTSFKLIVRGTCEGGPGRDVLIDMLVSDTDFVSGLTKLKKNQD